MVDCLTPRDTEDLGSRSASALRNLEERARTALVSYRAQVSRLESEITAQLDADQHNAREDWAQQLSHFESKLREQQADWSAQRTDWAATRARVEAERDGLQQKFDLAIEDVNRYRSRVDDLEQELHRRPEATQTDSVELVALRAERATLVERVAHLEKQLAAQIAPSAEPQIADLQRRFELAVEDVRELKTKNSRLESQLAAGGAASADGATDIGGMDWESQKRRLLASLDDENDEQDDPARKEERVRIADTIQMTDAFIRDKDCEIAELRSHIATMSCATALADYAHDHKVNDLVNADEVIAEHRERVVQLEREMEATLRAAELELSVERAKVARERVELDELRVELESHRHDTRPNQFPAPAPGAPRRRWLSKLGLCGDE